MNLQNHWFIWVTRVSREDPFKCCPRLCFAYHRRAIISGFTALHASVKMLALIVTAFYVIVSAGIFNDDYPRVQHPPGNQEHRILSEPGEAEVLTDISTDDVCYWI